MDVKDFYALIGESFEDVVARLRDESRIAKYVRMFVEDPSFNEVVAGFETGDCERAFRGAHTLKGSSSNMSFDKLAQSASELTEDLRPRSFTEKSKVLFECVKIQYNAVVEAAKNLN